MKKNIFLLAVFFAFNAAAGSTPTHLSKDEQDTVSVFKQASSKVVYVHRINRFQTPFAEQFEASSGAGSGVIWDKQGHVVTNYHVIHGADNLMVSFGNQTTPAKVIGVEPRKDLAVLALIKPKDFSAMQHITPFEIADTQSLVVGQKTIAIGNPFGLDHSLTTGVISALGREVPGVSGVNIRDMIQTDASINPGNSGGPLLDSQGRLIGLNTMIYSNSGASSGVGFAVPAEALARIVPQLIKYGRVKMAGIGIIPLQDRIANRFGDGQGVFISEVLPNTPAAELGLTGVRLDGFGRLILGDAIVAINHHPIKNYNDLYNTLSDIPIGEKITLKINRFGKTQDVSIKTMDISEER
ncbi:MAG: trypsin-like peptidase domain-containing protein [Legionellaceae bacterium]|nr:trypsin-like peptidase domain-containing protein [Legionellaceae bacterium]